jgi:hypothetical protein
VITESDLLEAIAECQGERNPNANTCIKLAAYYTILDNIKAHDDGGTFQSPGYSYATNTIQYNGESEFAMAIQGKPVEDVWSVMDELMSTLQVIEPRLYASVMRKL